MSRALVFDLDDTLYRERRFALSGYRAVARKVERDFDADGRLAFRTMALALRRGRRDHAFQELAAAFAMDVACVPAWIECYRTHEPSLRLSTAARRALLGLRGRWQVGILTNGLPRVQAAKVSALGLEGLVDAVVYAEEHGGGKPNPGAFLEVLARLGASPSRAVFAGDDPERDMRGARLVGMKTVFLVRDSRGLDRARANADVVVRNLADVPAAAERLLGEGSGHVH
jgi:putative hydrolase of the HAD superfamily